jgi:tRNA(adenine34) deaminase
MILMNDGDEFWMRKAIEAAETARELGEIPIGACLIDKNGELISIAGNRTITACDPTAHAEILVLREAAAKNGNYRLTETSLYTTIEPCAMCAGALVNARVKRLIFGATDERFGAVMSVFRLCDTSSLNHKIEITAGVLAEDCRKIIQNFFRQKRGKIKNAKFNKNFQKFLI